MENYDKGTYGNENHDGYTTPGKNNDYENHVSKSAQERKEESDDFHKYDNLSHSQDGERLDVRHEERIDRTGTDPNRYANLASQDTGSNKSMYNDEERKNLTSNDQDEDDDYDADDISDEEYSDEEEELRNSGTKSFGSSSSSDNERNSSPDEPFFTEGI